MGASQQDPADYGGYVVFKELVRAPGAIFTEARGPGQSQVLLQLATCRTAETDAEKEDLNQYLKTVTAATRLLEQDTEHKLLGHGVHREDDGDVTLYWALPWPDGAQRLGLAVTHIEEPQDVLSVAVSLLRRVEQRHLRGRLDPLLSAQSLIIQPQGDAFVAGFPVHLPPDWLNPEMKQPLLAPEEQLRAEPRRIGDMWRIGRTLNFLSGRIDGLPEVLQRVVDQLQHQDPARRIESPTDALQVLENYQTTADSAASNPNSAFASPQLAAPDAWPDLPASASSDLISDDIPTRPAIPAPDISGLSSDLDLPEPPDHPLAPAARVLVSSKDTDEFMQAATTEDPMVEGRYDTDDFPEADRTYIDDDIDSDVIARALLDRKSTEDLPPEEEDPDVVSTNSETSASFPSPIREKITAPSKQGSFGLDRDDPATIRVKLRPQIGPTPAIDSPIDPADERVTAIRAPSTIADGDTVMDVPNPRRHGGPDVSKPPPTSSAIARAIVGVDEASESTLRDVPKNQLHPGATSSGVGGPSAARNAAMEGKSAWDRAKKDDNKVKPLGPKGTLVGVRLINDPTGLRPAPTSDLPDMLPPPELGQESQDLAVQPHAPPIPEILPSADIPPGYSSSTPDAYPSQDLYRNPPYSSPPNPDSVGPQEYPPGVPPPAVYGAPPAIPPASTSWHNAASGSNPAIRTTGPHLATPASLPQPIPQGRRNALIGIFMFFVAGAVAALFAPRLFPTRPVVTIDTSGHLPKPSRTIDITPVNEVLLQASPLETLVVGESDGRILGPPPLRFLIGPGTPVAVLIAASGHEPQRVSLPTRGRLKTELVTLETNDPCEMGLDTPDGLTLQGVAHPNELSGRATIFQAAVIRATNDNGAWLVRCPQLGGMDPHPIESRPTLKRVNLEITGPANAIVYIDDQQLDTTPIQTPVQSGFRKISVEKLSIGRVDRWVYISTNTRLRMPNITPPKE